MVKDEGNMPVSRYDQAPNNKRHRPEPSRPWQSLQVAPSVLEVYWLPEKSHIPRASMIHDQKSQSGFYRHPIVVTKVDNEKGIAHFYATTSHLSSGISDLRMYFKIGMTTRGDADTLKLRPDSMHMKWITYINLEQRYAIEWCYLQTWAVSVRIDPIEMNKLENRIQILESKQNRCKCL